MDHEQWKWQEPGEAWKGVGIYHVTLTIPSREPLLGTLVIPDDDPAQARVEYSELGKAILECQKQVSAYHPEIQVLHYCLMPDHIHSLWYVKHPMPKGILSAVRGFWQGAKKAGRIHGETICATYESTSPTTGYHPLYRHEPAAVSDEAAEAGIFPCAA